MSKACRSDKSIIELRGLEPTNLLAMLAVLGLLRALKKMKPEWSGRIAWCGTPMIAELSITAAVTEEQVVSAADQGCGSRSNL